MKVNRVEAACVSLELNGFSSNVLPLVALEDWVLELEDIQGVSYSTSHGRTLCCWKDASSQAPGLVGGLVSQHFLFFNTPVFLCFCQCGVCRVTAKGELLVPEGCIRGTL